MAEGEQVKTEHTLISSNDEAGNVRTFIFETGGIKWQAGQYQHFILPHDGELTHDSEHWFTIAAAPYENEVHISTRITDSKYKQTLNSLKPGDVIHGEQLGGEFTWEGDEPVVLVAGGIGVTPYRSILLERKHQQKPLNAKLLYFNRDEAVPFKDLFGKLVAEHPELELEVLTGEPVTTDRILELAPEAQDRIVYLSGAKPMVLALSEEMEKHSINTKLDKFPGYDETNY